MLAANYVKIGFVLLVSLMTNFVSIANAADENTEIMTPGSEITVGGRRIACQRGGDALPACRLAYCETCRTISTYIGGWAVWMVGENPGQLSGYFDAQASAVEEFKKLKAAGMCR